MWFLLGALLIIGALVLTGTTGTRTIMLDPGSAVDRSDYVWQDADDRSPREACEDWVAYATGMNTSRRE